MHLCHVFSSRIVLIEISMQKNCAPPKYVDQLDYHVDPFSLFRNRLYIDGCTLHRSKSSPKASNSPFVQLPWEQLPN